MIVPASQDRAHSTDASVKIAKPISYMRTRPNRSPSLPTWAVRTVATSR